MIKPQDGSSLSLIGRLIEQNSTTDRHLQEMAIKLERAERERDQARQASRSLEIEKDLLQQQIEEYFNAKSVRDSALSFLSAIETCLLTNRIERYGKPVWIYWGIHQKVDRLFFNFVAFPFMAWATGGPQYFIEAPATTSPASRIAVALQGSSLQSEPLYRYRQLEEGAPSDQDLMSLREKFVEQKKCAEKIMKNWEKHFQKMRSEEHPLPELVVIKGNEGDK